MSGDHLSPSSAQRWYSAEGRPAMAVRNSGPLGWALGVLLVGVAIAAFSDDIQLFEWSYALVNAMFAFGCGIALSWAGTAALGQALYFAAGAFTTGLLVPLQLPTIVVLLAGAAVAGLIAFVFSIATLRLGFMSFAMMTLVVAQAGYQLAFSLRSLGGGMGLYGVPRPVLFGWDLGGDLSFYLYCVVILALLVLCGRWLYQSTTGRAIRASRDELMRAEALGISFARSRVIVFTAGGLVCGVAGVVYAQLLGVVDPSIGSFNQSTTGVLMVVLGGLGTFMGGVIGGILYRGLTLLFGALPFIPGFAFGLLLIAVVLVPPVVVRAVRRAAAARESARIKGTAAQRAPVAK